MKYEASSNSSAAGMIPLKQQNLAISFSLLEKIIKLISNVCGVNGKLTNQIWLAWQLAIVHLRRFTVVFVFLNLQIWSVFV